MDAWLDINKTFPGIEGQFFHAVNVDSDLLAQTLKELEFSIFTIDGSKIIDKATFFEEISEVFHTPTYFGKGWSSWDDYLVEFEPLINKRTAIIWKHADKTSAADIHTFLQAVADIYNLAMHVGSLDPQKGKEPKQLVLFLIGETQGFKYNIAFEK